MQRLYSMHPSKDSNETSSPADPTASPLIVAHDEEEEKPKGAERLMAKMLETRQLMLTGGVNTALAKKVMTSLLALEADDKEKPITLWLNSPGGSVNDGMAIYDTIRFIEPPVKIVCAGLCASIATIILIATEKKYRVGLPNTRYLIHQPLIPMEVFGPASDLEITASEILKLREKINAMLAEACGQPLDKVTRDTQRDYWMSAEQALEYGLITSVVEERAALEKL